MNLQSLEEQRQRRQEDPDSNVRSDPQPQPRQDAQPDPPAPSTVLVFHDQHRQEIQNYAIVGTMLWVFAPPRTQKISLADLDIPATTKANDDRGLDFGAPGGVSSPGELHPEALAEPDVNLSAHPAPIKQTCQSYRYPSGRREPFAPGQAVAETGLPGSYGL